MSSLCDKMFQSSFPDHYLISGMDLKDTPCCVAGREVLTPNIGKVDSHSLLQYCEHYQLIIFHENTKMAALCIVNI